MRLRAWVEHITSLCGTKWRNIISERSDEISLAAIGGDIIDYSLKKCFNELDKSEFAESRSPKRWDAERQIQIDHSKSGFFGM